MKKFLAGLVLGHLIGCSERPAPPDDAVDPNLPAPATLGFLYEEVERLLAELFAAFERVETQTLQLLGGGSLVLGLAGFSQLSTVAQANGSATEPVSHGLLIMAVVAYGLLAGCAAAQVLHRTRIRPAGGEGIWNAYLDQTPAAIQYSLPASHRRGRLRPRHRQGSRKAAMDAEHPYPAMEGVVSSRGCGSPRSRDGLGRRVPRVTRDELNLEKRFLDGSLNGRGGALGFRRVHGHLLEAPLHTTA